MPIITIFKSMKSNFLKDNNNLFLSKKETKVIFFPNDFANIYDFMKG